MKSTSKNPEALLHLGHTPGPWTVREREDAIQIRAEGQLLTVCEMPWADIGESEDAKDDARRDARLIAAAPDLLAALEQIAYSDFSADIARAKARVALAKAKE